jgi:hypothetical protein
MQPLQAGLFVLLIVAGLGFEIGLQRDWPGINFSGEAIAETQSDTAASRFGRWTRARFQAAKKHWAEHEQWFSECNRELESRKKSANRMSYDRQAHFLEDCIRRKH